VYYDLFFALEEQHIYSLNPTEDALQRSAMKCGAAGAVNGFMIAAINILLLRSKKI
jgi:hypothetical protein